MKKLNTISTKTALIWSAVTAGFTLFSMFFGAGNLIFAPFLGSQAASAMPLALTGFLLTAVLLPGAAILLISCYGSAVKMISVISKPLGVIFMALCYFLIGPCIAIPRTASTSFEMLTWLFGSSLPVRIIYTVLFFFLAAVTAYSPGRMQKLLGRIMGPVLIGLILLLAAGTLLQPANTGAVQQVYSSAPFVTGFFEGYQTLDLLAAFNLGAAFTLQIKSLGIKNEKTEHNVRVLAVLTAGVLLCTVYTTLAVLGMKQSAIMEGMKNGAQVLSALANVGFGQTGRVIIGLIFLIACFNVCSSILSTAAQYYHSQWKWMPYKTIVTVFAVLGAVTACLGLDVIVSYTAPILSFLCPVALIFMIAGGIHYRKEQKKKRALLESGALAPADSIQ